MQIGQFLLQLNMEMGVAANVTGAARTSANIVQGIFHGLDHFGVLPHGEVIVGAPHGNRLRAIVTGKTARIGEGPLVAHDVDKDAVAAFGMEPINRLVENLIVIHVAFRFVAPASAVTDSASDLGAWDRFF